MPDQVPIQTPTPQQPQSAPIVSPDLSVSPGLIDDRPIQAPLPNINIPGADGGNSGQVTTISQLFSSIKTPSDEKKYLNPVYTPQPLTKRYSNWNPNIDNEEVAATKQPWYDKWANGLVKMGATAIGTFAQSLMTLPDTVNAVSNGSIDKAYQSDFENNVDGWLKNIEDQFPNYYSKWEQSHPFLSALPFPGGFSNFWSDKVVKNLGFTLGAIGGAVFQDTLVGLATEGLGEIPLIGNQIGKAALWFNKIFSNETKLGEFLGAAKPGLLTTLKNAAEATPASQQALFDLKELATIAAGKKVSSASRFAINLYGAARTEAGFEARDGFNTVKQDLIDRFKLQNQRDPTADETTDIEKYATAGANVRFGVNMALLTLSDAIQFDNILKPFSAAKHGITGSLQKALENKGAELTLKEGTIDTFERKAGATTVRGKIWEKIKPMIPNILAEGVYEEGGQYAAQVATQNYYERKYFNDKGVPFRGDKTPWSPSSVLNVLHSTMQGLSGEFGTSEGWENIVLGGLTAILTGGVEHWYDKVKGHSENSTNATLALLNNNSITGLLQNMYGNATKSAGAMKQMQAAAKSGDLFTFNNHQSDLFTNFILSHLQGNRFDVAVEKLNIAKDLPQAEFEKAFGIDKSTDTKQTVSTYIDNLKERAQAIKNNYDAINQVFENPYKFNRKAKNEDGILENDKHTKFEEWKATLLEHTSNIDDSNRRIASIQEKAQKVNPAITRDTLEELTHPTKLLALQKDYEKRAAEIEKSFADKLVPSGDARKDEEKQLAAYKAHIKNISDFFNSPAQDKDQQFLKTFDGLLHFKINGETPTANPIEVRKQNLPSLIQDGVDSNRLQARKIIASKAYDILTSEKGFNKYFSELQKREATSASIANDFPVGPLDIDTDNLAIPIKLGDKNDVAFQEGKQYTLNTGSKDNPEIQVLNYQGVDEKGDLQFTNQKGEEVTLPASQLSTVEDYQKATEDAFKKDLSVIGSGSLINSTEEPIEEDKKKDLSSGPLSTTDPRFEDTTPFNNFHQRHQTFLFNLGSTDPNKFNQEVKPILKILPVTAKIAEGLGFPKELTETKSGEEPTIRAVYVTAEEVPHLLDEKGNKIQALDGSPVDLNKIIFTTFPDTSLQYQGQDRYTNKQSLDPAKVQAWQKAFRESLLVKDASNMPLYQFAVSRGLPNIINQDTRNSVVEVGLISEKDLNKVVITIPTQGDVTIGALLNDEGEGIASSTTGVKMPLGVPLLNYGGNLIYLNNRKLTTEEADNATSLLIELARRAQDNKIKGEDVLDQTILKYLSRILYFSSPQEGKAATSQQIWVDKNGLHLGPTLSIPFFANLLMANENEIKSFLKDSYHHVNNYELSRASKERLEDLKFNKVGIEEGKLVSTDVYPTYSHYLLNSKNPPLATNIAKPVGNEIPIVQKYSVIRVKSFDVKAFEGEKKIPQPTKPAITGAVKQPAKATTSRKRILDIRHSETFDDKAGITSGIGSSTLTKEGIEKAKVTAEELLDKGISNIISSPLSRAVQTSHIIATVLGTPVDTTSSLALGLKSWDIGQFDGTTDKDFNKAQKYFVENPTSTEFEGKNLGESFQAYVDRFLAARNEIQEKSPDGTLVITHSKNLKIWDAYNKSNKTWDTAAAQTYLTNEAPGNTSLTKESKQEIKDNELAQEFSLPDGRRVKYAQIFDAQGNLSDIRIIAGIKEGQEVKLPEAAEGLYKTVISQALGLTSETPQITTTPTDKETSSKLKNHKGKPNDSQYRAAYVIPSSYTPGNVEEEFEKASQMLPDWVQFKMAQNLIHMTGGGKAWGAMKDAAIYVYKNAEIGTTYHEAFELIWQNFLEAKQQLSLYTEFKGREGTFYTYNGEKKAFIDANFKEAKEQIAEEFRDYVLNEGKTNLPAKQKNWFQRLVDFIKRIFLGNEGDINSLFKNITQGYYKNYPASQKNINSIEYKNIKASEAFIQDVLQGMTADLFAREFERDSAIVTQLEENPKQAVATVYGRLFNSMQYFFTSSDPDAQDTLQAIYADKMGEAKSEGEEAAIEQEFNGLQKHWDFIKSNWNEFVNEHMQYLRVFKVEFSVDDNGEITMDSTSRRELEDYEKMTGQSEYARDMMTINARNAASEKVKLLFATIADREFLSRTVGGALQTLGQSESAKTRVKRETSQVRMPKLASYAKTFNYVLHNVTNINGIYDIFKKLVQMSNNTRIRSNAVVDALVNRLNFKNGFKDKSIDQAKMLLSVENTLNKQKPSFVRQFVDDQGNVYFKTSIVNSRVDQVVDNWITNIKGSDAVKVTNDSNFIFNKSVKDIKDPIALLNAIGIQVDSTDYGHLSPSDKTKFDQEVNALRSLLEENIGKKLPIFTTKQIGIDSRLSNLAALYVDKMVGDDTDSMHFNLDGELTSNFVLPNFASTIQSDANNSKTRDEFIAKNPHFNDIFHKDSILLNDILFDKDGKFTSPVNIAVVEGRESSDTDNKAASALTEAERYIYEINNNLQGVFYTLLPADAKTEWAIYTGQYIKASEYFDEVTNANAVGKFYDRMWSNLQTEIALAQDFKTNPNRQNITELGKKVNGRKKGDSLRFFQDILPADKVSSINKVVIDGGLPIDNALSKAEFTEIIKDWVNAKAEGSFKYLSDNKIFGISNQGNLKLNGLLTDFVSKNLGSKRNYFTKEEAIKLLNFREMNYVINNIEMHKFFFGDPAQYSDEMKRIKSFLSGREWSHVDYVGTAEGFNQWANGTLNKVGETQLQEGDPGYHVFKNEMNTLTLNDIFVESSSLPLLQRELGEKGAKPYEEINEADAQTLQKDTSYRETLLKAGGRWTQQMESQHQWELAWTRNDKAKEGKYTYSSSELEAADKKLLKKDADPDVFFYITKPVHSGVQSVNETAVVSLDKTSSAPLYYRFVKGTHLEDVYNVMEEKGSDYYRVESAHKVGIQNDANIPLYKEDGSINKEGIMAAKHESIPYKQYGIQVDTSARKEGQTEGSQLRKQAVGDLMDSGVPIDYKGKDWNTLNEEDRKTASPLYSLIQKHEQDLSALSNKRYENLLNKLGVRETEEGYDYQDVKKISDFLLNEVTRRELPNNLRDAIQPDPENTRQFKVPLEALSNYQQIRSILWSTIEKNIIRPKVSGGMKTQLAATGWEKAHRIVKTTINGKQVLTSSELKFYSKGEDGRTAKCEVYLPFWFGKKVRASLEKNGKEFKSDKEFRDHILNYLNNTLEGKKLLSGIGFRIPTQRDNSIESFIVKDFLPEQMGDTIVLPSEITAKAGSDFDIDKMSTYLRNFFINKQGYPQSIPFEEVDSNDTQQLQDYYEKYMLEPRRAYEQWQRELGTKNLVNKIFQAQEEDKEPEYVPTLEEYLNQAKGKTAYELNSLEALENKYFDTLEEIYALPEKFKGLVSPNDASDLKKIANKISKLKDPNWSESKQPFGRVLDSLWMMQERHKYLVGKKGVGIAAVSQTNLNVNQNAQVYLKLPRGVSIRLPYNTVVIGDHHYVSLGAIRNQSGENISKVNASFIDGYVDIAKGAWIIDMGANDNLAKNFLLMTKWGTDPYDVALFMNQPAIQMYANEQATRKSVSQINKEVQVLNSRRLYEYVSAQFKAGLGKVALDKLKPATYSRSSMEDMISKYGKGEKLTQAEAKVQMQMLSDFQEYDKLAWDMFRFFQGYNWDTSRLNDPNLERRKMIAEGSALRGPISSIKDVFKSSFIGTVRDNTIKANQALKALFSSQTGKSGQILDAISRDFSERRGLTQEEYRKSMLKAELSTIDYTTQTTTSIGNKTLNQFIQPILLSDNSVARYLKAIQESGDIALTNNPIIKNLRANIDKREGKPSTIELIEKDNDSYTSNIWTDAFRELADSHVVISIDNNKANDLSVAQIYRRMVLAAILQSGTKRSSTSFLHLIPNEHYSAIVKDSLRDIKSNLDAFYDNNILYRTNWDDDIIVPTVSPIVQDDFINNQLISRRTYPGFNSDTFNEHLKDQGITSIPKTLRLDAFSWRDKKVVKTVEYIKDPKTKQVIDRRIRLYQRVDTWADGFVPLVASRKEIQEGDFMERNVSYVVFKEINKWGDSNRVQEYYDGQIDSKLSSNPLVTELNNELVTYAIMNSGYSVNSDEYSLAEIATNYANSVTSQGEGNIDTEDEASDNAPESTPFTEAKTPISFKQVQVEDTKRVGKKDFFNIVDSTSGEVGEVQGYKVTVSSHPNMDLYVRKNDNGSWDFTDNKSGKFISNGDTAKEAIKNGIDKINSAIRAGNNIDVLNNLGVAKEIDDILREKDKGCK